MKSLSWLMLVGLISGCMPAQNNISTTRTPNSIVSASTLGASTLYRAINLNGQALTYSGLSFEAGSTASNVVLQGRPLDKQNITLSPSADSTLAKIIRSSLWGFAGEINIKLTQIPSGDYDVFLYVWEDNNSETFSVLIDGTIVQKDVVSGSGGSWKKLGPFRRKISSGSMVITSSGGAANFSALEMHKVAEAPAPAPAPESTNLIINSGFESSLNSWSNLGNASVVSSPVKSGSAAVRIGINAGGLRQMLTLKGSTPYVLSGFAHVGSGEDASFGVSFKNSSGVEVAVHSLKVTETSYTSKTVSFTSPASFATAEVWAWKSSGPSYLYLDDLKLEDKSVVSPPPTSASCSGVGSITHEKWDGISGTSIASIPLSKSASAVNAIKSLEISNLGDNYGTRISGYVCPPVSGNYVFHISGDDDTKLSISSSEDPAGLAQIAGFSGWTSLRELGKYPGQKSQNIALQAGKKYFIEVLHKEGGGGDHVTVGWDMPDGKREFPLPESRIAPKNTTTTTPPVEPGPAPSTCKGDGKITLERMENFFSTNPLDLNGKKADVISEPTLFEAPTNIADNYGTRMSGQICVPETGDYVFYIAGDDQVALFLSTDENAANKKKIAYHDSWSAPRDYSKFPTQTSAPVKLIAGQKYYIEALHVEQGGGDNLSVGWKLPNGSLERPIPGHRLLVNSAVGGETTSTPAPKPSVGSTVSVDDSFNPSSVTYAAPLVITKGGTYSGNWESKKSGIAAVTIKTNEPVIIENSVIRGAGILISAVSGATNLEVRNSRGYGLTPTSDLFNDGNGNTYRAPRRFLSSSTFKRIILENNYLENTAGINIADGYVGTTATDTIKIRYNKIKNIDGRVYGTVTGVNFVGLNYKSKSIPNVEIAWNQVVNEPGNSRVEDNINIYNSRGTPESPIRIHNNYIQGAYGLPGEPQKYYSGGGILTDCPEAGADKATAYLKAYENQVINSLNYGMGIAGGNNIHYYNNRVVNSGFLPDGRNMNEFYPNAWPSGYYGKDYYNYNSTFNNLMENNVVGVKSWESRNDLYFPESQEIVAHKGWIILPNPVTLDFQKNEWNIWGDKVKAKGIKVGPQ